MKIYDGKQFREMTEEELAKLKDSTPVEEEEQESAEDRLDRLESILTGLTEKIGKLFRM